MFRNLNTMKKMLAALQRGMSLSGGGPRKKEASG